MEENKSPQEESQHSTQNNKDGASHMFNKRYVTAGILITLLLLVLFFKNNIVIWSILGVFFILSFKEALDLLKLKANPWLYGGAVLTWVLAFFNSSPILSGLITSIIIASILAYKQSISIKNIFPFIYPTLPFLAIYALYAKMGEYGISCLIWLILIVGLTDTGAYFGGRIFGRTPLSPTSPKKTLEGAGIGVAIGIVAGSIAGINPSGGFIPSLLISICVSIASVFGDLFESHLKREAGVKDSGKILPGHGGILDRFDGILFGAMVMYYLLGFLPMWKQL